MRSHSLVVSLRRLGAVAAVVVLACGTAARAEEPLLHKGKVELSTAATLSVLSDRVEDQSTTIITVPVRAGYFITRNLALEGELALSHISYDSDSTTGVLFQGFAVYHLNPDPKSPVVPFLLVGGGLGNGVDSVNGVIFVTDVTTTLLSAGAGIKGFVGERAALRLEYRFTRTAYDEEFDGFREAQRLHNHRVFAGISLFFR
jgi:hypothetical protein